MKISFLDLKNNNRKQKHQESCPLNSLSHPLGAFCKHANLLSLYFLPYFSGSYLTEKIEVMKEGKAFAFLPDIRDLPVCAPGLLHPGCDDPPSALG